MKHRTLLIAIVALLVFMVNSCDNRVGKPDIRPENKKGDMFYGWKWNFKW